MYTNSFEKMPKTKIYWTLYFCLGFKRTTCNFIQIATCTYLNIWLHICLYSSFKCLHVSHLQENRMALQPQKASLSLVLEKILDISFISKMINYNLKRDVMLRNLWFYPLSIHLKTFEWMLFEIFSNFYKTDDN